MTAVGLGCAKTPAVAPHVELSLSNCICGSQIILHKRRSMPCRRIVFSTFRGCMSFYTGSSSRGNRTGLDAGGGAPTPAGVVMADHTTHMPHTTPHDAHAHTR